MTLVYDLITSKKDQLNKYFTYNTSKFIDQTNFGIFMLSINQPIILEDPMKFISIFLEKLYMILTRYLEVYLVLKVNV